MLNVTLRATNNGGFGRYIAAFVDDMVSGQGGQSLVAQIKGLAKTANTTQVLQLVLQPGAYANLTFSPVSAGAGADMADRANYAVFEQSAPPS